MSHTHFNYNTLYIFTNKNVGIYLLCICNNDNLCLQVFHFNEWKYINGTAMFFEKMENAKTIDPLYDNRCDSNLQYVGSTRKSLEMTKKDNTYVI